MYSTYIAIMSFAILHKQHVIQNPSFVSKYTNIPTIKIFSKTQSSHLALRLSNEQIVCHAKAHFVVSVVHKKYNFLMQKISPLVSHFDHLYTHFWLQVGPHITTTTCNNLINFKLIFANNGILSNYPGILYATKTSDNVGIVY